MTTYNENDRAALTVSDEGPGIPKRVQQRMFERFYTGDSVSGSGLGLAIGRELAQRMGGRIAVTSSKGFNAFTLDLPPAPAPAEPRRRPDRGERVSGGIRPPARRGRRARCLAAGALAFALAPSGALAGCGGSGGETTTVTVESGGAGKTTKQIVVAAADAGFDAARVFREDSPGVVTIRSIFGGGSGLPLRGRRRGGGIGLRPRRRRRDRHQRPRGDRGQRRQPHRGRPGLRRVPGPQRRSRGRDRLRPLRRRRPAQGRARRARDTPARAGRRP